VNIDSEFRVSVPSEQAWGLLTDLAGIAPCMPGAQLTGVEDGIYSGKVKIKVGPVTSEYAGTASFVEQDATAFRAVISAKGRDPRGAGNASATIVAHLRPELDKTVVRVETDLKISGKIAQFGSGMIQEVSEKLLGQFVDCLEATLSATKGSVATGAGAGPSSAGTGAKHAPNGEPKTGEKATNLQHSAEPEAINVMELAGGSLAKRLVPALIALVILAMVIYRIVR